MKKYSLHIVIVFISVVALNFHSCKPKKQEIPPVIDVHLDVKDENNKVIDSATVYLYDSKEAFDVAYSNSLQLEYSSNGAVMTTKVVKGKIDFKELPSNKEYWVLIHDDSESFKDDLGNVLQYKIDKDNSEANYKIDGFQNGSIVTANIKLTPVSSLVKFDNGSNVLEFSRVEIRGNPQDKKISNSYLEVRKGDVSYMARTEACVWTGAINAEAGKVITEPLVACNYRMIIFSLKYTPVLGEELSIYIGQNKINPLAKLNSGDLIDTVYLDNNSVASYYAESYLNKNRRCIFQDSIPKGQIVYVNIDKNCK